MRRVEIPRIGIVKSSREKHILLTYYGHGVRIGYSGLSPISAGDKIKNIIGVDLIGEYHV